MMHRQYTRYPFCNDDPSEVRDDGEDIGIWRYEVEMRMGSDNERVILTAKRERFGGEERLLDWRGSANGALQMVAHSILQDMMVVLGDKPPVEPEPESLPEPARREELEMEDAWGILDYDPREDRAGELEKHYRAMCRFCGKEVDGLPPNRREAERTLRARGWREIEPDGWLCRPCREEDGHDPDIVGPFGSSYF